MQLAFPVVGAIAFAGVISELVTRATDFVQKVNKAPQDISNGFRELNLSALSANDTLAVTNDRLANEIAKLQGKPENNLALAIDEARVAADKLASSLDADNSKMNALLERNHQSAVSGLLGRAGTADVEGSINSYNQKFSDLGAQRNVAPHSGDIAGAAALQKAIDDARQSALNWAAQQIRQYSQQQTGGLNQDANLLDLRGFQGSLLQSQDRETGESRNAQLQAQKSKAGRRS